MELHGTIRGRAPVHFHCEVVRELTEDDLLLRKITPVASEARPLIKMRYQHHRLAQLLSSGAKPAEASLITGYSPSRISILQADPAFQEIFSHYMENNKEAFADLQTRMAGFALNALDELQDRLEGTPEVYTNKELLEAVKVTNDRGGNSPIHRSQQQISVLTSADIAAIKKEVKESEHGRIIEGTTIKTLENNPGIEMGTTDERPTTNAEVESAPEGVSSERENV